MPWDLNSDRPIFIQIIEQVQLDIISGKYSPGEKLPSVRELAAIASVNPNTMQKALSDLERSGLVFSQRTSGRFITEDASVILDLKTQLAKEKILDFLKTMENLGFQREETIKLIIELPKGDII